MEWNAKSASQWDLEHLLFVGSGCSGSELIHSSSSRSSKSASISSSSIRDSKPSIFTFESSQDDASGKKELSKEETVETSHAPEPSSVSGEPLLALKLGKRSYFENVCQESDSMNLSFSVAPMSSLSTEKKCKSNGQNIQCPRCQVEGCGLDLSLAKDYHRKHRVCESHSKSPKVVISGLERRFCQQCSRFHSLEEFDEKKRSCRRRLSDHNARRRKPHPQADQLNQSALSSSHCDGKQQTSPFAYSRTATNLVWQNIHSSKLPQTKDFLMKPAKGNSEIPSIVPMLSDDPNVHFASKALATRSINPGIEDSITSSDPNASRDFHRALSLLSTNSRDSYETKSISLEHSNQNPSTSQPITHAMSQCMPLVSSEYWHTNHDQQVNSSMWISYSNCEDSNHFQKFQLSREPYESGFHQLD